MATIPNRDRLDPRTAATQHSIWRITNEDTFRQNIVSLAKACKGVAWSTDTVTLTTRPVVSRSTVPSWSDMHSSEHRLPLAIERRLCDDFAFIAAVEEGVHRVTAACIEEKNNDSISRTKLTLTLRLAANGGIPESVRNALEDIWQTVQTGAGLGKGVRLGHIKSASRRSSAKFTVYSWK